jgi:hypothetical protein
MQVQVRGANLVQPAADDVMRDFRTIALATEMAQIQVFELG